MSDEPQPPAAGGQKKLRVAAELLLDEPNRSYARELAQAVPVLWALATETEDGLLFESPEAWVSAADAQAIWNTLVDMGVHAHDIRGGVTTDGVWRPVPMTMDGQIRPPPHAWLRAHPQPLWARVKALLFPRKRSGAG